MSRTGRAADRHYGCQRSRIDRHARDRRLGGRPPPCGRAQVPGPVISWYRLPPMGAAAFYDLDGTLVRTNLVHAFAFTRATSRVCSRASPRRRHDGQRPAVPGRRLLQPPPVQRHLLRPLQGRVRGPPALPGRGAVRERVQARDLPGRLRADRQVAQLGLRQVVVTGALDFTVQPLAGHLGVDDYVANRLEFVDGVATGRLLPPVMAARDQGELDPQLRGEREL